ncbi:hypothetical protein NDU88_003604 [Pleurodeles waltl]|uniref:Uncharacterized protein n=1 Tax=Pleurodeles waltl TaxID=8319 RepID=A0AAV7NH46_PLEWA|nr:hypothetical protein NDU88_003604 [Pleurodeles waltl]
MQSLPPYLVVGSPRLLAHPSRLQHRKSEGRAAPSDTRAAAAILALPGLGLKYSVWRRAASFKLGISWPRRPRHSEPLGAARIRSWRRCGVRILRAQ